VRQRLRPLVLSEGFEGAEVTQGRGPARANGDMGIDDIGRGGARQQQTDHVDAVENVRHIIRFVLSAIDQLRDTLGCIK
jgi:hypothetical protein